MLDNTISTVGAEPAAIFFAQNSKTRRWTGIFQVLEAWYANCCLADGDLLNFVDLVHHVIFKAVVFQIGKIKNGIRVTMTTAIFMMKYEYFFISPSRRIYTCELSRSKKRRNGMSGLALNAPCC